MKKLLVTAIGAAAALGAVAGTISTQRFENVSGELPQPAQISSLNELAGGNFWSGDELTNTYTYISCAGEAFPQDKPLGSATKALEIKTTFGSPLTVKAIAGDNTSTNIPASGIYFDSLVKFTVCEEEPEQTYDGAKIIMWLQEETDSSDNITGTNIMVRASYVNADVTCTPTNFVCKPFSLSIDDWHRVTIKTLPNIVNGNDIPGFVIFLNGSAINVQSGGTMASEISANLTEAAEKDGNGNPLGASKVFASLVQGNATGKSTITSASFDGTGKLTDLVFTDEAPFDGARNWESDKANVYDENDNPIDGSPFKKLADAVAAVNVLDSGTYTFRLANGIALTEPLAFTSEADVILDFAGFVLTNNLGVAAITNNSANLVITNSVGVGGIYCVDYDSDDVDAIYNIGTLTIGGGTFWGLINVDPDGQDPYITGGTFQEDVAQAGWLAGGKTTQETADGLYEVVDIVYYTVGFYDDVQGEGSLIGTEASVAAGTLATAPAAPTKTGYTFVDWTPSTNAAITADTNFYPTWSANSYTITYYDGENVLDLAPASYTYGTGVTLPASAGAKTGYTFDGWYDNAGLTGDPVTAVAASETGNQTFYAKYTAIEYTITYKTAEGEAFTSWADNYDAPATFTVAQPATLPTASDVALAVGVTFNGWTNDVGTAVTDTEGLTANLVVFANVTVLGPVTPTIDPASDTAVVPVQEGETAEQAAARVEVGISSDVAAALTSAGVSESTYQGYFSKTAVKDGDNWNVTAEFTDTVETAVATAAEAVVNGTATTVTIPAGLYYKVTTYTALGGTPTVAISSTLSTGAASSTITKPGTTQGFIKIELDTAPIK